jgi:hypothetical protein
MATYPKTKFKIAQIARMRVAANCTDAKIAEHFNLTLPGLQYILKTQEYRDEENAIFHGQISAMDEALAGNADAIRKEARIGVPVAMKALLDAAMQRKDLKSSIAAARELLDRDPDRTLIKAQPDEVPAETLPDEVINQAVGVANKISQSYDKTKVN